MAGLTSDLHRGAELAGYRIEALLGRGGMGVVYLAEQRRLKRRVALKLLSQELAEDERFRERFLHESELAASLDHPNVVPIFDAGEAEGWLYIAMRYVEGTNLANLLAQEGRLEPEQAVPIIAAVAGALDAAHSRGLVHRDVKPANVLLASDGHVYLADFGLTRSANGGPAEQKPHLSGTLDYVAPEQIEGAPPDPAADVYALGCVLYHCLAGQPPFAERTQMELLWAHFSEQPPSAHQHRPELPHAIDEVIAKALAKDPGDRYPGCGELAAAAAGALGVGLVRSGMTRRRLLLLAAGGALGVAAAAAIPPILLGRGGTENTAAPATVITRDSVQRIDPDTNELVATIPFGQSGPRAQSGDELAVGEGAVWVIDRRAQTVDRIDPSTNTVADTAALPGEPNVGGPEFSAIAVESGGVWVSTGTGSLVRIDPRSGLITDRIPLRDELGTAWLLGHGLRRLWFHSWHHELWQIDLDTGEPTRVGWYEGDEFRLVPQPEARAGELVWWDWVAHGDGPGYAAFELATGELVANFSLDIASSAFFDDDVAWVSQQANDTVLQLHVGTGQVARAIHVGKGPRGIVLGAGSLWVANSGDGTVSRIDPSSGEVIATIEVGGLPASVAVGEGGVWMTTYPA